MRPITLTAIALLTTLTTPVIAWAKPNSEAFRSFCGDVRNINASGLAVSPGTPGSYRLASELGVTQADYRRFWDMATTSDEPLCRGIY